MSIPARKSYYEVLEVSEDASEREIKRAFKRLAWKCHPDTVANSDDLTKKARAESEMKRINQAKEILLNTELRAEYDKKLNKLVVEVDWSSEFIVDPENDGLGLSESEEDWEFDSDNTIDHEFEPKTDYYDYNSEIIHSPPPRTTGTVDDLYGYKPWSERKFQPNSGAVEIAPGVLFLQKCLQCGRINIEGKPYCQDCYAGLIYDNHPFFYNQGDRDGEWGPTKSVPIKPGQKPDNSQGILVISKCFRCGSVNTNNRPYCQTCQSSMIYYKRPLPMDRLKNLGKNRVYTDFQTSGTKECPRCGAQNHVERKFCYGCFARLDYITNPPEALYEEANGNLGTNGGVNYRPDDNGYKKCPKCNELNSNVRDFCQKCNTRLVYYQPPISTDNKSDGPEGGRSPVKSASFKIDCPHCGTENAVGGKICISCYQNLISEGTDIPTPRPRSDWQRSSGDLRVKYYGYKPCPNCRCENDFRAEFCQDCGFEFNQF